MATKIRLQRHGRKGNPYFHIIIIDSKKQRQGHAVERIGSYDPNTNPATIKLDFDRALHWVKVGAQPTDTVRAMLSYKGVLMKHHLDKGVSKGAHTQEIADAKFEKWLESKSGKIEGKKERLEKSKAEDKAKRLAAEALVKENIAQKVQAKKAVEAPVEEVPVVETETPATEIADVPAESTPETPAAEVVETTTEAKDETTEVASDTASEGDSKEEKA